VTRTPYLTSNQRLKHVEICALWEIRQRVVAIICRSFRTNYRPHLQGSVIWVVPKRRYIIATIRCVNSQKSTDLIYFAAGAWNEKVLLFTGKGWMCQPHRGCVVLAKLCTECGTVCIAPLQLACALLVCAKLEAQMLYKTVPFELSW
jgi:hypothetical protein